MKMKVIVSVVYVLVILLTTIIHIQSRSRSIALLSLLSIKSKNNKKQKNETISIKKIDPRDDDVTIQNTAHDASSKINLAAVDRGSSDLSDDELSHKQTTFIATLQMGLSIASMVLSRYIFKMDFKDKDTVKWCRLIFCGYLLLSQLFNFLLSFKVRQCQLLLHCVHKHACIPHDDG